MKEITSTNRGRVRGSYTSELGKSVAADASGGSLFGSILAGLLLGLGLDAWLSTSPWFTIGGIILGSVSGFMQMWRMSNQ